VAVTIYDVAGKAGVSITTVSHVMHDRSNIPESTRNRVLQVMREIHYTPNPIAQRLVTKKTQTLALLIPTIDNPFFAELYRGIDEYIEHYHSGYRILIGNMRYSLDKELALIRTFRQELVDGYIVVSNEPKNEEIQSLIVEERPVVFAVNDQSVVQDRPLVTYNNYEMARRLTEHLVELGHRRIGYVAALYHRSNRARSRFDGFRACLAERKIPFDPACFVNGEEYSSRCGYELFTELGRRGRLPTALFCANDVLAVGVLHGIREAGYTVPGDISIVGYDNIPCSAYIEPPLTTVHINPSKIGFEAAGLLLRLIGGYRGKNLRMVLPGEIVFRASCAPPPARTR
jgi:LacI family transcriptional regulator